MHSDWQACFASSTEGPQEASNVLPPFLITIKFEQNLPHSQLQPREAIGEPRHPAQEPVGDLSADVLTEMLAKSHP